MARTATHIAELAPRIAAFVLAGCAPGAPQVGGQTSDFGGSIAACTVESAEIGLQQARDLGFSVDADLAFFGRTFEASFHRGMDCSAEPSVDGHITFQAELERVLLRTQSPVADAVAEDQCPEYLAYQATTRVESDPGLVSGYFTSEWVSYLGGIITNEEDAIDTLSGSLGIRVDRDRPHNADLDVSLTLRDDEPAGSMLFSVYYADDEEPEFEQGEGIRFPVSDPYCDSVEPAPTGSPLVRLDEYQATR